MLSSPKPKYHWLSVENFFWFSPSWLTFMHWERLNYSKMKMKMVNFGFFNYDWWTRANIGIASIRPTSKGLIRVVILWGLLKVLGHGWTMSWTSLVYFLPRLHFCHITLLSIDGCRKKKKVLNLNGILTV